jgi:hypothetical protein
MTKAKIVPDKFAVFAVDPGGTTGCATGLFRTDRGDDMLYSVIDRAVKKKSIDTWEEEGGPHEQAWSIVRKWVDFRFRCNTELNIPIPHIHLVCESFHLRTQNADLSPVLVIGGMLVLLYGREEEHFALGQPDWQMPSEAKRVTNSRLRSLGLWVRGSEHRRDALRHIVTKVDTLL